MARATMVDILARLRLLVNDRGTPQIFTDDELEVTLDQRRTDIRYLELDSPPTIQPPGPVVWLDVYAPYDIQWWEADAQLFSNRYAPVTPATSDLVGGHWTFATTQLPPVYIIGKLFDVYAAAADTLELWIAQLKLEYDTRQNRLDLFQRSQRITTMTELAASYRAKQRPLSLTMSRPDMTAAPSGNIWLTPDRTR